MSFLFATCQPGGEARLKREVALLAPGLRPAYARRGLVTFKESELVDLAALERSVYARRWGRSLGFVNSLDDVAALLEGTPAPEGAAAFLRAALSFAELSPADHQRVTELESALCAKTGLAAFDPARPGRQLVVGMGEPGEPLLVGTIEHAAADRRLAGGLLPAALPSTAPSRAYLKVEEAALRFGLDLRRGERVLELGSAPGGGTLALLQRGLGVVAVDPGEMAPAIAAEADRLGVAYEHRQIPAGALTKKNLPKDVAWLVSDMNLSARIVLRYADRVVPPLRRSLRGVVLTMKLGDAKAEREVPDFVERVRRYGFAEVRAHQLPSHRSELAIAAFR